MPEVAMTLALLGTRLRRIGMVASAAWSNRLPSTNDRWLESTAEQWRKYQPGSDISTHLWTGRTDNSQFVPLKSWFCFVPTYCLAAHLKGNCATQTTSVVSYPRVMQASLTTWERRSLADSLNAASMSRSCCRNPSNSAAPARSSERTFFSWRNREGEEAAISKDVLT